MSQNYNLLHNKRPFNLLYLFTQIVDNLIFHRQSLDNKRKSDSKKRINKKIIKRYFCLLLFFIIHLLKIEESWKIQHQY